ncbi:MAG TPA: hypothetical protein VJM80_09295 [bacterium]|nr:hypothetical protein [bacterium]
MTWFKIFLTFGGILFAVALFAAWSWHAFGAQGKNLSEKGK